MREALERLIAEPGETPEGGRVRAEAAELLVEWIRLEGRVRRLVASNPERPEGRGGDLAGLTLHEAARVVLEDAGVPLHARELGERIKARGWRHPRSARPRPDQIVFQLAARLPRHSDVFRRVAPNTFALRAWDTPPPARLGRPVALFRSGVGGISEQVGERPDAPFAEGAAAWRSS